MAPRMRLGRCCLAVVVSTTEESHLKVLERDLNSPKPRQTPSQTATFSPTLFSALCPSRSSQARRMRPQGARSGEVLSTIASLLRRGWYLGTNRAPTCPGSHLFNKGNEGTAVEPELLVLSGAHMLCMLHLHRVPQTLMLPELRPCPPQDPLA